ncbi:hypothetical protein NKH77_51505 [Streptomyces sp. M19]
MLSYEVDADGRFAVTGLSTASLLGRGLRRRGGPAAGARATWRSWQASRPAPSRRPSAATTRCPSTRCWRSPPGSASRSTS